MMLRLLTAATVVALLPTVAAAGMPTDSTGRQSLNSDTARGGADIYLRSSHSTSSAGGSCTLSFVVRRASGKLAVLTAGHCVEALSQSAPYSVFQTQATTKHRTYLGDQLGVVAAHRYHVGTHGDNALVTLSPGRDAKAQIFTGGARSATTAKVAGRSSPRVGMTHLCYSGAVSGQHCGYAIRYEPRTMDFPEKTKTFRIHHEWSALGSCSAKPGDSGSPVFLKRGTRVTAVGILSGGGSVDGKCALFFTSVTLALSSLHVKLLTSK